MKTCPICKTQVFDDMDCCYECMHRFEDEELEGREEFDDDTPMMEEPEEVDELDDEAFLMEAPEVLENQLEVSRSEDWTIRIEVRSTKNPDRVCRVEMVAPFQMSGSDDD